MKAIASNGIEIHTGDAVLVRDSEYEVWSYCHFSHKKDDSYFPYCTSFTDSMYCIPYNGNEELVGTTNNFIKPKVYTSYIENQRKWINKNNIKVGSKVKIIKKANSEEGGWGAYWNSFMDDSVNKVGIVTMISDNEFNNTGIQVYLENKGSYYFYPYFVLEKVEDKNEFRFGARVKAELGIRTITGILVGCRSKEKWDHCYRVAINESSEPDYIGEVYWCSKIEYLD